MFKTGQLKSLVQERLMAAAEEIFSLFEQTFKDYEEEVFRFKQQTDQQQWKAPVQLPIQEKDIASEPEPCQKTACLDKDEQECLHIKKEEEDGLWTAEASAKQGETVTKETMFKIIYVQRSDENGGESPHQRQDVENKGDSFPSSSSQQQWKAEPPREGCDASEATTDCQLSENSDDERRDSAGFNLGSKISQQGGETAYRPYSCSICNKTFRIKSTLTRHMKTHTGEKPYCCSDCGKSFIRRSDLQTHINSHLGKKPYTCNFCGKGFTQVGNMNTHIRIHTGEKPHSCTHCGKSFKERADLIKHTVIHTGEKPYGCTVCNMKFSAQSNLTRHMKIHSGERPHSCAFCGKRFIRRSHLIIHMKTHAGENS